MALIAIASDKGAPGVTTAALALAAVWPRPVLLAECDQAGGDLVYRFPAAGGGRLDPRRGVLSLAVVARRGMQPQQVWEHVQKLHGGLDVLAGVTNAEQGAGLSLLWGPIGKALAGLPQADVIADCGRLGADGPLYDLLIEATTVVLVSKVHVADVIRLRDRAAAFAAAAQNRGRRGFGVGVVVVAEHKKFRAALGEVQHVLGQANAPATVLGGIAHDTKGADLLSGEWGGNLDRTMLIKTAREVAQQLAQGLPPIGDPAATPGHPDASAPGYPGAAGPAYPAGAHAGPPSGAPAGQPAAGAHAAQPAGAYAGQPSAAAHAMTPPPPAPAGRRHAAPPAPAPADSRPAAAFGRTQPAAAFSGPPPALNGPQPAAGFNGPPPGATFSGPQPVTAFNSPPPPTAGTGAFNGSPPATAFPAPQLSGPPLPGSGGPRPMPPGPWQAGPEPARPYPGQPESDRPERGRPEPGQPESDRPERGRPEPGRLQPVPASADVPPDLAAVTLSAPAFSAPAPSAPASASTISPNAPRTTFSRVLGTRSGRHQADATQPGPAQVSHAQVSQAQISHAQVSQAQAHGGPDQSQVPAVATQPSPHARHAAPPGDRPGNGPAFSRAPMPPLAPPIGPADLEDRQNAEESAWGSAPWQRPGPIGPAGPSRPGGE
jgi:hypothetical protein